MSSYERAISFAIRGFIAVVLAIAIAWLPGAAFGILLAIVAAYALFDGFVLGVLAISTYASGMRTWRWLAVEAVVGIGFGLVAFTTPHAAMLTLFYLIAIWAIVTGVLEIVAGVEMRQEGGIPFVIGGGLSLVFGIVLAAFAHSDRAVVAWSIAGYAFTVGIALTIAALSAWQNHVRMPVRRHR